jgi:hypothetical protein
MDLFERKIQLLEQRGWFEGFDHQRDAVDRLLPTIRAAADPITRDLYLGLASKRSGVSKEVLERELANGRALATRERTPSSTPESQEDAQPVTRIIRTRNNPEAKLVAALIAGPEWIAKAREEVSPTLLEVSLLRELFEALIAREQPSEQMPDGLSTEAAAAWSYLKETVHDGSGGDIATVYDRASQILRARPLYRQMHVLSDPGDKRQRRAELRARFPAADAWYEYQKAARRDSRRTQRSRGA